MPPESTINALAAVGGQEAAPTPGTPVNYLAIQTALTVALLRVTIRELELVMLGVCGVRKCGFFRGF